MSNLGNNWILIDDSHPKFDRWEHTNGYIETFPKGQNPNRLYAYELFGELVKDYCVGNGITQGAFADRINVSESTLSSYMTGRHKPGPEVIAKIESITGYKIV